MSPKNQERTIQTPNQSGSRDPPENIRKVASEGIRGSGKSLHRVSDVGESFRGVDLTDVTIHTDSRAQRANEKLGSRAYTFGGEIAFSGTPDKKTLAHEVVHIIQQRQGVTLDEGIGRPEDRYEREAERISSMVSSDGIVAASATGPVRTEVVQMQTAATESPKQSERGKQGIATVQLPSARKLDIGDTLESVSPFLGPMGIPIAMWEAAQAFGVTIGYGPSVSGGAGSGVDFGGGILLLPDGGIGFYGGVSLTAGYTLGIAGTAQVTVIDGGIEVFGGRAYAANLSIAHGIAAGVKVLLSEKELVPDAFIGISGELGIGEGIEVYGELQKTWTSRATEKGSDSSLRGAGSSFGPITDEELQKEMNK